MKTQNEFLQLIRATREYAAIAAFYGERKAERSQVPLMRHIEEGCAILWEHAHLEAECDPQTNALQNALARAGLAARAYCLHPLFQADPDLLTAGHHIVSQCDPRMVMLAMEYRARANDWLSDKVVLQDGAPVSQGAPDAGVLAEVHLMLVADKVQNHKDFAQHHRGTHARSAELEHYFQHWLQVLGVDADAYERLTAAAAQFGDATPGPVPAERSKFSPLAYANALELYRACKRGSAKFFLHYHDREPRALTGVGLGNDCIWVEAGRMLPVHIRHDGSSKDGPSIWLEQRPAADAPATPSTSSD